MDSEIAIRVATDILEEHFGPVVAAVAQVLLQRGRLRLQEVLVYLQDGSGEVDFSSLRNAMLVLLQHRLVTFSNSDESYAQVYKIEMEEILSRLRFPQYLEHVHAAHGQKAYDMLLATLKYGRISKTHLITEVAEASGLPRRELEDLLERLVKDRILRTEESRKRKRPGEESNEDNQPSEVLYRYDRVNLNLCIYKNLVCRVVEEQADESQAQVMMAMLSSVMPDSNEQIVANALSMDAIFQRYQGLFPASGRDPLKIRERVRQSLELLTHKEKFLRQKSTQRQVGDEHIEWTVDTTRIAECLRGLALTQLMRDRFGTVGLRIFNLLQEKDPPQKLEENHIFKECMIDLQEGREILQSMVKQSVLQLQQVPRSSDGAVANSVWLYYVDMRRVLATTQELTLNAILNLRVRFRTENLRIMPLETRANSLTAKERQQLRDGRRVEDLLERGFLVLDAVLLVTQWKR